jgi:4a-hydroxytetrahydrobiopterin dehydratase
MANQETSFKTPEGWTLSTKDGPRIARQVKTKDFMEAVGLINKIAQVAEELNHHPDLHLESWNKLRIETYSHDVGKLTERDERLAKRINTLLATRDKN